VINENRGSGSGGDIEAQDQQQRSSTSPRNSDGLNPTHQTSPRQSLHDIFDLMFETPTQSILEHLSHQQHSSSPSSLSYQKLLTELEYVYKTIEENDTWKLIDELADPVIVLSAKDPHVILKCSMSWLSMMGCKSSEVFGKILENFIHFPDPEEATNNLPTPTSTIGVSSSSSSLHSSSSTSPEMMLHEVISTLETLNQKLNTFETNHLHCILPLQHCQSSSPTNAILKCSIHCYPIYKKLSDEEISIVEKPRYFLQKSGRDSLALSSPNSHNQQQQQSSVAFYLMSFNHFNLQDTEGTTPHPPPPHISSSVRSPLRNVSHDDDGGGGVLSSVSTTEMSPLSSHLSSASVSTNLTEKLRKQGLANDL
jgi:hypothetical protein